MPMLYIGRSILANSGGAGQISRRLLVHLDLADQQDLASAAASPRSIPRACSTMPACAAAIRRRPARCIAPCATRTSTSWSRRRSRCRMRSASIPQQSDLREASSGGDHDIVEGPYITAPHKAGDIFTHAYNGGGGYRRRAGARSDEDGMGRRERLSDPRSGGAGFRHRAQGRSRTAIWWPISMPRPSAAPTMRKRRLAQGDAGVGLDRGGAQARRKGRLRAGSAQDVCERDASCRRASPMISASSGTSMPTSIFARGVNA